MNCNWNSLNKLGSLLQNNNNSKWYFVPRPIPSTSLKKNSCIPHRILGSILMRGSHFIDVKNRGTEGNPGLPDLARVTQAVHRGAGVGKQAQVLHNLSN